MRVEVVLNSAAGSADDDERAQLSIIEAAFTDAGAQVGVRSVEPDRLSATLHAIWGSDERPDAMVIAGGDGTINTAAQAAAGTDLVIGVLPLGTFNHFAKDLGMPTDLTGAVAALVTGSVRLVDVGDVNGRVFVNNSAIGVYPDMVAIRDRLRERRGWGKVRAAPVAAARVLRFLPVHRLDLIGETYDRRKLRTPVVFVGNGVFANTGGGIYQRDDLTAGRLGVTIARAQTRFQLVSAIVRTLLLGSQSARGVDVVELEELTIRTSARRLRVALDGETEWLNSPLHYRIRPGALKVMAPSNREAPQPRSP
jgi:diacylglycerol kinase family enzyme